MQPFICKLKLKRLQRPLKTLIAEAEKSIDQSIKTALLNHFK